AQLCSPVRWRQTLHRLANDGATALVELGPGKVLTGMAKRTLGGATTLAVSVPDDLDRLLAALAEPAGPPGGTPEGEHLFASERLVVSPGAGVFTPASTVAPRQQLEPG